MPAGLVECFVSTISCLHDSVGVPWYGAIALTSISARTLLLPVVIRSLQAGNTVRRVSLIARRMMKNEGKRLQWKRQQALKLSSIRDHSKGVGEEFLNNNISKANLYEQTSFWRTLRNAYTEHNQLVGRHDEGHRANQHSDKNKCDGASLISNSRTIQSRTYYANPLWLVLSPLSHVPILIAGLMATREMTVETSEYFDSRIRDGGTLWFTDLALPVLDQTSAGYMCPMGIAGITLPALNAAMYFINVQMSFKGQSENQKDELIYISVFRLVLEWITLPVLLASLHMPHSALIYWLSSNIFNAVVLNFLLRENNIKEILGVNNMNDIDYMVENSKHKHRNNDISKSRSGILNAIDAISFEDLMKEGKALAKENRWEEAANIYLTAAEQQSLNYNRKFLQQKQKNQFLSRQNEVDQQHTAMFSSGVAFHKAGYSQISLKTLLLLDEQLQIHDKGSTSSKSRHFVPTQIALAQVYKEIGKFDKAISSLRKAARVDKRVSSTFLQPLLKELGSETSEP